MTGKSSQVLGIILARAGSQGLANKHLLPLLGRPVIEYTFEHAKAARRLSKVVLTSDCARLRLLAQNHGIDSIDRPSELATADATVQAVCLHALRTVEASAKDRFDAAVVLYGNVPVRPAGILDKAIAHLLKTGCDSVRTLSPVGKWHPAWMHRLDGDVLRPLHSGSIHRRQDLEPMYLHDGAAVVVSRASLLRAAENPEDPHAFFGVDRRGIVAGDNGDNIEIDQQRDLYWAEAVLRDQQQGVRRRAAS